jgi:hypothetical protein
MNKMAKKIAMKARNEISFSVNQFDTVKEYTGKYAWAHQVMSLLLLKPGTYPSFPKMGIDLGSYEFTDVDSFRAKIIPEIEHQVETYLPEVPLAGVQFMEKNVNGKSYILILLSFSEEAMKSTITVAAQKTGNIIDFAVEV